MTLANVSQSKRHHHCPALASRAKGRRRCLPNRHAGLLSPERLHPAHKAQIFLGNTGTENLPDEGGLTSTGHESAGDTPAPVYPLRQKRSGKECLAAAPTKVDAPFGDRAYSTPPTD